MQTALRDAQQVPGMASVHVTLRQLAQLPSLSTQELPAFVLSHRNPFFPKYFLSVGDWTWRVWNEDLRSPLLVSPYAAAYLSSGTWSPTRPGGHVAQQWCVRVEAAVHTVQGETVCTAPASSRALFTSPTEEL
jgi:hypothetical protein